MKQIEYRGCVVSQSDYNNHVAIVREGKMVFHAPVTEKKTESQLKNYVDFYFMMVDKAGLDESKTYEAREV